MLDSYHLALRELEEAEEAWAARAVDLTRSPGAGEREPRGLVTRGRRRFEPRLWALDARTETVRAHKRRLNATARVAAAHDRWIEAQALSDTWARTRPGRCVELEDLRREALVPYPAEPFECVDDFAHRRGWRTGPTPEQLSTMRWTLEEPSMPWIVTEWCAHVVEDRRGGVGVVAVERAEHPRPRLWWMGRMPSRTAALAAIDSVVVNLGSRNTLVLLAEAMQTGAHAAGQ